MWTSGDSQDKPARRLFRLSNGGPRPRSTARRERFRGLAVVVLRRHRPEQAELVPIWVGEHDPSDLGALADVGATCAQGLQAGNLGGLVLRPQVELQAALP